MRKVVLIVLLFTSQLTFAQKYDYHWILSDLNANMDVLFTDSNAQPINNPRGVYMDNGQTTISDSAGDLLFFTNGVSIYNRNNGIMVNGDSLNYGAAWDGYFGGVSYDALEDMVGLPTDTYGVWNLIHYYMAYTPGISPVLYPWRIEQTKIDMRAGSGLGAVVYKNKVLVQDTLGSYVNACKHANGRDWWVLASQSGTNCLYTMLLQNDTAIQCPMQCLGGGYVTGDAGQAAFSPDGSKFAWLGGIGGINIYDFDRCTGLLSNPINLPFYATQTDSIANYQAGLAFSPNSRFLYITQSYYIFQFDLNADSIVKFGDTIGLYIAPPDTNSFPGTYFLMQLGADGKIYISANNSIRWLHVINQPDEKGDSCNFVNYGFALPKENSFGLPSYPGNYRLGPLHGSPCDTIYRTDTTGKDTTGVGIRAMREKTLKIYPNPATDYAIIDYGFTDWSMGTMVSMEITDAIGRVVYTQPLPAYSGFQKLDVSKFAAGLYNVAIKRSGAVVATAKLVKE